MRTGQRQNEAARVAKPGNLLVGLMAIMSTFVPAIRAGAGPENTGAIAITMTECDAQRPSRRTAAGGPLRSVRGGAPVEALVRKGSVTVGGQSYELYLPQTEAYSVANTGKGVTDGQNTATLVSIDANRDGQLTDDESWYANLPVRIGDEMYRLTEISQDGSRLVLEQSSAKLRGLIVGRKLPRFFYNTRDGAIITQNTYRGKAFLLDIWSVT